jgi:hypothetical protein
MSVAPEPERQIVHRLFTVRWMSGFAHSTWTGTGTFADDPETRQQITAWGETLRDVRPQLGPSFVTMVDTTRIGPIPRSLWLALVAMTRTIGREPVRRAILTAEGSAGDNQAETAQLVTAGNVRVFRADQIDEAIAWLGSTGVVTPERLRRFFSS